ncbi:MAG: thioredoxin domain-containing protein [Chloroflexi bacterium]|nr:thioredoxin domain-containing protein [Chloroflexota bacterium]
MISSMLGLHASYYEDFPQRTVDYPGFEIGDPDAPNVMIEFIDYSCSYCYEFWNNQRSIIEEYVRPGHLRIIAKPMSFVRPAYSQAAAEAAICAGEMGRFWEIQEKTWATYRDLGITGYVESNFIIMATDIGLDEHDFVACIRSYDVEQTADEIEQEARDFGVTGTPSLLLNNEWVSWSYIRLALEDAMAPCWLNRGRA